MSADPPIRPDGCCEVCGKPLRFEALPPLYRREAARDPFCSSVCARAWHGCPLPVSRYEPVTRGG